MAHSRQKHEARDEAHEAGIRGASKMSEEDARQALQQVRSGAEPRQAKGRAKND